MYDSRITLDGCILRKPLRDFFSLFQFKSQDKKRVHLNSTTQAVRLQAYGEEKKTPLRNP